MLYVKNIVSSRKPQRLLDTQGIGGSKTLYSRTIILLRRTQDGVQEEGILPQYPILNYQFTISYDISDSNYSIFIQIHSNFIPNKMRIKPAFLALPRFLLFFYVFL